MDGANVSNHAPCATFGSHDGGVLLHENRRVFKREKRRAKTELERWMDVDVEGILRYSQGIRQEFVRNAHLEPPKTFRVIDCKATIDAGHHEAVVLVNWCDGKPPFTAVSHTWGFSVYEVFDCGCATKCEGSNCPPRRKNDTPCTQYKEHREVVMDILRMVCTLWEKGGAQYVWHDGVCIAQHDESEVDDTIKNMGWVYAYAQQTVIFLDYVGSPMAPIKHDDPKHPEKIVARWHTRVWTLQEAVLSQRRRYCVRVGSMVTLFACKSLEEFETALATWYEDATSQVQIIEEPQYSTMLRDFTRILFRLMYESNKGADLLLRDKSLKHKVVKWHKCLDQASFNLQRFCLWFPRGMGDALVACVGRDSKHPGDRLNSILVLASVKDFTVPKEFKDNSHRERMLMEFLKRAGRNGLADAVFTIDMCDSRINFRDNGEMEPLGTSWLPNIFSGPGYVFRTKTDGLVYNYDEPSASGPFPMQPHVSQENYQLLENGDLSIFGDPGRTKTNGLVYNYDEPSTSGPYLMQPHVSHENYRLLENGDLSIEGCLGMIKVCFFLWRKPSSTWNRDVALNDLHTAVAEHYLCRHTLQDVIHMYLDPMHDVWRFKACECSLCHKEGAAEPNVARLKHLGWAVLFSPPRRSTGQGWASPLHALLAFSAAMQQKSRRGGSCRAVLLASYEDADGKPIFTKLGSFTMAPSLQNLLLSSSSGSVQHINHLVLAGPAHLRQEDLRRPAGDRHAVNVRVENDDGASSATIRFPPPTTHIPGDPTEFKFTVDPKERIYVRPGDGSIWYLRLQQISSLHFRLVAKRSWMIDITSLCQTCYAKCQRMKIGQLRCDLGGCCSYFYCYCYCHAGLSSASYRNKLLMLGTCYLWRKTQGDGFFPHKENVLIFLWVRNRAL